MAHTVTGGGSASLGGTAAVDASQGSLLESGSPGTITAQIVSLTSAQNIGTTSSPFLTNAASGLTVDETATSSVFRCRLRRKHGQLSRPSGSARTTAPWQSTRTTARPLPCSRSANNQLSETGSTAVVTFANTDTTGGTADNVDSEWHDQRGQHQCRRTDPGQELSTLIEDTVMPTLILSAGNGIGNPTNTIDTEVAELDATTKTGGIFISNQPISGSGATVTFTASNGAITSVTSRDRR